MTSLINQEKPTPLSYSREQFADYWTALISRLRQDDDCDQIYSGSMPHPLVMLQKKNQQQIRGYDVTLVAEALLQSNPIEPTEMFINAIKIAAATANQDPPLAQLWTEFNTQWSMYKKTQRKIYAIAISTLRVGSSMHYARSVPVGAGTHLLTTIYSDNL